jgi:NTP pyrophosphatase (non-canonical NTP hydrolase)
MINNKEILLKAINKFGVNKQIGVAIEEMAELIKVLSKYSNRLEEYDNEKIRNDIAEEMADVEIMFDQLRLIFNMDYRIDQNKKFKIERLKERVEK